MSKNKIVFIMMLLLMFIGRDAICKDNELKPFTVYYSDKASIASFAPYKLIALDSEYHPKLSILKQQGKTLLGYISLGEVEEYRSYYHFIKNKKSIGNPFFKCVV